MPSIKDRISFFNTMNLGRTPAKAAEPKLSATAIPSSAASKILDTEALKSVAAKSSRHSQIFVPHVVDCESYAISIPASFKLERVCGSEALK